MSPCPKILCPSMMCADFGSLKSEVEALVAAGSDMLHLDVMDGRFVPNFGMGLQDIAYICRASPIPCDVHLMVMDAAPYVSQFAELGVKVMYVHPESDLQTARTLHFIRESGAAPAIAVNPGTSFESVEPLLNIVDYVCVMTVNPGFAGQEYLKWVDTKIDRFLEFKPMYGYKIIIDGACSPQVIAHNSAKGVDGFVLGTSALFGKGRPYGEIIPELRVL